MENNNLTKEQERAIARIDEIIEELESHKLTWTESGNIGKKMAEYAESEIKNLEIKKLDVINGTNNYQIKKLEHDISILKKEKNKAILLAKIKYNKQIRQKTEKLNELKTK